MGSKESQTSIDDKWSRIVFPNVHQLMLDLREFDSRDTSLHEDFQETFERIKALNEDERLQFILLQLFLK